MNTHHTSLIEPIASGPHQQTFHQAHNTLPRAAEHQATPAWGVSARTLTGEALTIRKAKSTDAAALAAIGRTGFATVHQIAVSHEEMNDALASAWSEKHLTELIANSDMHVLVAEIEKQIVGMSCLNPTYRPAYLHHSTPIELCRFYLHTDWMGCGVGSKLIGQSLRQAVLAGYGICWLRVWQGNKTAIDFYRRWGFTTISADYYAVGNTLLPVWVMIHPF